MNLGIQPKKIAALGAVLLTIAFGGSQGPAQATETLQISGREFVRLSDWASSHHLETRWLKRDNTLLLSNRDSSLRFTMDSTDATVNGVQLRLLFPAALHNGDAFLSQTDLRETLSPILSPPKDAPGHVPTTVCLDPGHGGRDPGFHVGAREEKQYTLLLAEEVRDQLAGAGYKVSLTRSHDTFVELPDRADLAHKHNADLFVSLHFNSTEGSRNTVQGVEVYCLTPAGAPSSNSGGEGGGGSCPGNRCNDRNMLLAYSLQKAIVRNLAVEDRGVHRARFAVLRDAMMPAALIEAGFLSHPQEGKKILDPTYRKQMAKAIVEGVQAYKRAVRRDA